VVAVGAWAACAASAALLIGIADTACKYWLPQYGASRSMSPPSHPAVAASGCSGDRMSTTRSYSAIAHRWIESLPWIVAIAAFFALPSISPRARILIYILYALSLDLIVATRESSRWATAPTSSGAYVAGISPQRRERDPMLQLAAAAAAGALLGSYRRHHPQTRALTLLMLTLAITSVSGDRQQGNCAHRRRGCLPGRRGAGSGLFKFDTSARQPISIAYSCCSRVVVGEKADLLPSGLAHRVRENSLRMHAIGAPVYWRLVLSTRSRTIAASRSLITRPTSSSG